MVLSNGFWPFPLHSAHSLPLLIPLFPSTPTLSVVKHVVKGPFLTRCGITAVACSEGPFFMFRFGVLYLCRGREARGFFESGVSIFNTPIQRIRPGENVGITSHLAPVRSHHRERNCRPEDPETFAEILFHLARNRIGECLSGNSPHNRFKELSSQAIIYFRAIQQT